MLILQKETLVRLEESLVSVVGGLDNNLLDDAPNRSTSKYTGMSN